MTAQEGDIFCPVHGALCARVDKAEAKQEVRPCVEHGVQINHIIKDIDGLEDMDSAQWTAINNLRRLVYIGMGGVSVAAFFGSLVGQFLISMFAKR